jgi:hypothetical protein
MTFGWDIGGEYRDGVGGIMSFSQVRLNAITTTSSFLDEKIPNPDPLIGIIKAS